MTTFRLLPDGHRRRLPNGGVRALGADGLRYTDVEGHVSFRANAASAATLAKMLVGESRLAFTLVGNLDRAGFVGTTSLRFGASGHLGPRVNLSGIALLSLRVLGQTTAAVAITGTTWLGLKVDGGLVGSRALEGQTVLSALVIGDLTLAPWINISGAATLRMALSGDLTANNSAKLRDLWLDVYDKRQKVLNAIDANNRNLAISAGDAAGAVADAVVATTVRVNELEDGLQAEATRVTALQTAMGSVQSQQTTQASAISALQTWSSNASGTLSSHSSQISSFSASITNLNGQVTNIASVTSLLQAEVDSLGAARAIIGFYTNVNGLIAGMESINDGRTAELNFLATVFRVLTPDAANGMEVRDGYIRVYSTVGANAYMMVIGSRFGENSDLMMWYGTLRPVNTCTQANCVECKTFDGKTIRRSVVGNMEMVTEASRVQIKQAGAVRLEFGIE